MLAFIQKYRNFLFMVAFLIAAPAFAQKVKIKTLNPMASPFPSVGVQVDGYNVGFSNTNGFLTIELKPGTYEFVAKVPGFMRAKKIVLVENQEEVQLVELIFNESDVQLRPSALAHPGVLDMDFQEFDFKAFGANSKQLVIDHLFWVAVSDVSKKSNVMDITEYFELTKQNAISIKTFNLPEFKRLLQELGPLLRFEVQLRSDSYPAQHLHLESILWKGEYQLAIDLQTVVADKSAQDYWLEIYPSAYVEEAKRKILISLQPGKPWVSNNMPNANYRLVRKEGSYWQRRSWDWSWNLTSNATVKLSPESLRDLEQGTRNLNILPKQKKESHRTTLTP